MDEASTHELCLEETSEMSENMDANTGTLNRDEEIIDNNAEKKDLPLIEPKETPDIDMEAAVNDKIDENVKLEGGETRNELSRHVTAGLAQICQLFAQANLKEKCHNFTCTKEKRDMLDVISKLVEGIEFLINSFNIIVPKMTQIAKVGQNTSKIFNLGLNFDDDLNFNLSGIDELIKLVGLVRDRFSSLGPVDETLIKKTRLDHFVANLDIHGMGTSSTLLHDPSSSASEDQFMNSKFLQLSNGFGFPGSANFQPAEVIELSDDEDRTSTISMVKKAANKPTTSKIQPSTSNVGQKRLNGLIHHTPPRPVAAVNPFNSNTTSSLLNPSFNIHRPNILRVPLSRMSQNQNPRFNRSPPNMASPRNQNAHRPSAVNNTATQSIATANPPIRCQLFRAVSNRDYFSASILQYPITQSHPRPLPVPINLDPRAPNIKNITANTNQEPNNYCCVHLFVEFEYKFFGQKLFLHYYLKSQAENGKLISTNIWSNGGSHSCNQNGATVIKMRFQDVRPDEILFVSLRLGSDTLQGNFSTPLVVTLGQPRESVFVNFNEQHQITHQNRNSNEGSSPALIEID